MDTYITAAAVNKVPAGDENKEIKLASSVGRSRQNTNELREQRKKGKVGRSSHNRVEGPCRRQSQQSGRCHACRCQKESSREVFVSEVLLVELKVREELTELLASLDAVKATRCPSARAKHSGP